MFNKKPYKFGVKSSANLSTLHEDLQMILKDAIQYIDFSVLCGHRDKLEQNQLYKEGKSKVQYPNSKHNTEPSLAVDIAPYPINWNNTQRFAEMIRFIQGLAFGKWNIRLRVGMDWNCDYIRNESFYDFPHVELHSKLVDGEWLKYEEYKL